MPAAVQENSTNANSEDAPTETDRNDQMWKVLKSHILRERARKKQEREAEVEEERLRKEREAREQQDVMTLGETREQISQLESKLQQLKDEKHQLFLQLKKVLNEDDNRRRQLVKETSDMIALQSLPQGLFHQQLYIAPSVTRPAPILQQQQQTFKPAINKRPRSPSPQPAVSVSLYHQNYGYKPGPVGTNTYQSSPQKDDGRRHELVRAVLWNKTPQPSFYRPAERSNIPIYYPQPQAPLPTREPTRNIYEPNHPQQYHLDSKLPEHYALRPQVSHPHVIHGGALAISSQAPPKSGNITGPGYPVRAQTQYQQIPTAAPALYTAQSRPLYQSPGTPMNYPQRD